jgi:hypothetical protein
MSQECAKHLWAKLKTLFFILEKNRGLGNRGLLLLKMGMALM